MNPEAPVAGEAKARIGTVLDRRYRIDRLLGMGGIGAVYAAWHLHLERPVAIKILHPYFQSFPEHVERFRLEAHVMGLLGHENIVQVIDFRYAASPHGPGPHGLGEGQPYLVMELVEGETLRERLKRGPLPL